MEIQIFMDSVYVGYIEPYKTAFVNQSKNYQIIHHWSSTGEVKWIMKGSCNGCMRDMILLDNKQSIYEFSKEGW